MAFEADLPPLDGSSIVFIGPGNKTDMMNFAEKARLAGAPFFFDPGQSLNIWNGDELREAVSGALCFISNDYELSLFLRMTDWTMSDLYKAVEVVITTRGPEGAVVDIGGDRTTYTGCPGRTSSIPRGPATLFALECSRPGRWNFPGMSHAGWAQQPRHFRLNTTEPRSTGSVGRNFAKGMRSPMGFLKVEANA